MSSETLLLGEKAKSVAIELVKQQAARDILAAINKWRSRISTANRRWIFELVQNAVDTARARGKEKLKIVFECNGKTVTFKHNAGYFTLAELDSLIYGTSSKPWGPESEYLGRFGTGFLVSHIVSRSVKINGRLRDDNGSIFQFALLINREGNTVESISSSIEDCFTQLDTSKPDTTQSDNWTTYTYTIHDDLGSKAVSEGVHELKQNVPILIAFNPIEEIAVGADKYVKQNAESLEGISKVKVSDSRVYFIDSDNESFIQVGIVCDDKGISEMAKRPSIFIGMPLTESTDYLQLPFVINSLRLKTTQDRDSLENTQGNVELMKSAFDLYLKLLEKLLALQEGQQLANLYRSVQFQPVSDNQVKQNPLWGHFNDYLNATFKNIVSNLPLVKTNIGRTTISDTVFPHKEFDGKKMDDLRFAKFCELVKEIGRTIPDKEELSSWIQTAALLQISFPNDIALYSLTDLKEEIENSMMAGDSLPSFEEIGEKFDIIDSKAFMKDFYGIADSLYKDKMIPLDFIKGILPNQSGILGPVKRTWAESKVNFQLLLEDPQNPMSDAFKDIVTKIGKSLRDELIHEDFSGFQIVQDYVHKATTADEIVNEVITDARYALPDKISTFSDEKASGWIELFRWCAANKKLVNGFQVITKSLDALKLEDINKETLLMPFAVLKIDSKFEEIYPESKILNDIYLEVEETTRTAILEALKNYRVFIFHLPSFRSEIVFPYEKLKSVLCNSEDVSKVDHSIVCQEESGLISYLPFWNEVIGRISDIKERARLLFIFVMEYLANEDKSWQESIQVNCSCREKVHEIIPSNWLASLKTDAWIPIKVKENGEERSVKTSVSKDNIESLFDNKEFDKVIAADPDLAMSLLPHFHFDKLDLKIKLHSLRLGKIEAELRDDASTFVELVGVVDANDIKEITQNPAAFQQAVAEMKKNLLDQQLKEENKIVGENIQKIMLKIVNTAGLKLKANPIHDGGDMEIWPNGDEGIDYGEIKMTPFTVEVKSTSGTRVHLSKAQSVKAREKKSNFVVLVVEDTGTLREQLVTPIEEGKIPDNLIALLVERSHALEEIYMKLGNFPNPDEVEADINGYWIKRKLWEEKIDLREWLTRNFKSK